MTNRAALLWVLHHAMPMFLECFEENTAFQTTLPHLCSNRRTRASTRAPTAALSDAAGSEFLQRPYFQGALGK